MQPSMQQTTNSSLASSMILAFIVQPYTFLTENSTEISSDLGVPQGSALGPLLFILHTPQLTGLNEKHSIHHEMFADDTKLSHSESPDN